MNSNEYLQHYGILGMKWGRKKSSNTTVIRTRNSEDHDRTVSLKRKKISEMSNSELKLFNERMQLERQYKDLSKKELSPGKKFVTDLITKNATQAANQYISKYSSKMVDDLLKKTMKVN